MSMSVSLSVSGDKAGGGGGGADWRHREHESGSIHCQEHPLRNHPGTRPQGPVL